MIRHYVKGKVLARHIACIGAIRNSHTKPDRKRLIRELDSTI